MVSEKRILAEGLLAIQAPDLLAWRNNTGQAWQGTRMRAGAHRRRVLITPGHGHPEGSAAHLVRASGLGDILGVGSGFGFALEAKAESGRQSDQQKKFQAAFERAGGRYGLFRSREEAVALVEGWRNGVG
jgi:hypothetical protein